MVVTAFTKGKGDGVAIPITFHSNHKPDSSFLQFTGDSGKGLVLKLANRFLDSPTCTRQNNLNCTQGIFREASSPFPDPTGTDQGGVLVAPASTPPGAHARKPPPPH